MDLYAASRTPSPDRAHFAQPGAAYRGTPFWSWNGKLERGRLLKQLDELKTMGMGGAHMHARTGLATPYLGDAFMAEVKACVAHAREHGMLAWLYDEDRWPSGFAGGLVTSEPAFRQRCLLFTPKSYAEQAAIAHTGGRAEAGRTGTGELIARYALRFADGRLAASRRVAEGAALAADEVAYWAYLETPPPSAWYNHQTYVDVFNPAAIRRFIEVTHERYRAAVGDEFGRTVPAIFTDEPLFTGKGSPFSAADRRDLYMPWTPDLAATLQQAHGVDIVAHLPWLFFDPPAGSRGPEPGVPSIRWAWHDHIAERFRTAFAEPIAAWCAKHGILMTGHLESEATLVSQTARNGECMRFYQPMQLPGVDMLCDSTELTTVLQTRSVARQEGRPGVMSELYGVTNWDFTFAGHKRHGDWQAALGVTVRVQHLAWYTMAGEAKRDYPAPIDAHSPWWRAYPLVEDHFARVNACLTRGAPRCRVGVVHPIESMWLAWGQGDANADERESLEAQFRDLTQWLVHGLIDADFVAESLLPRQRVANEGTSLRVGCCTYDVVLVPGLATIRSSTLDVLERFAAAGGRVVFVGRMPALVDAQPSDRAQRLAVRCASVIPERAAVLAALAEVREVRALRRGGAGAIPGLAHQLRADGAARWLFVCNTVKDIDHGEAEVGLRGAWRAEAWDTRTGTVQELAVTQAGGWSTVAWHAAESAHLLIRWLPGTVAAASAPAAGWTTAGSLPAPSAFSLDEPNVLLLDRACGSLDGAAEEPPCEVLRLDNRWRERLGWGHVSAHIAQPWAEGERSCEHRVRLRYRLEVEAPVAGTKLAMERAAAATISLDGVRVTARPDGWWVDEDTGTVALPPLAAGTHDLVVELPYGRHTTLEWAYLLGAFGVRVVGERAVITAAPTTLAWGDLGAQGLPFYAGNITYRVRLDHAGGRLAIAADRLRAPLAGVRLDGREAGAIAWGPWRCELGEVAAGTHELEIVCYGDRRNAFGQVHHARPERFRWWGPNSWRTTDADWSEEYVLAPHGMLTAPRVLR